MMRRSTVINHLHEKKSTKRKHSSDDRNSLLKSKKRRHLSPNHVNSSIRKGKSSKRTSRKSSSRRHSYSTEHLNEITLPNWERISPNIDQILSNKHTQSGVYAHEVHLVQQELEALLSMSILRENLLQDLLHPTSANHQETIRSKILQHKEAEDVYTSKKLPVRLLPPLINHQQQRQKGPNLLLDRQVSMTPVIGARIDKIWSDMNSYYHKVSSNDILNIENLVQFNQELESQIQQYQSEHRNHILTQMNIIEQLNEENFQELLTSNPLTRHYIDRTTIGRFQTKLYEHVPHTSPVYKTPISSPFYRKSLGNSLLRSSPRLHSNSRLDHFKSERSRSTSVDHFQNLQERVDLVRNYLADQHPSIPNDKVKRRKNSFNPSADEFQTKLSNLRTLFHECSMISQNALNRARRQSSTEQIWQKLNNLEHDLELLIEKIDTTGGEMNSTTREKSFQTLDHLLKDWKKYHDDYQHQLEQFE